MTELRRKKKSYYIAKQLWFCGIWAQVTHNGFNQPSFMVFMKKLITKPSTKYKNIKIFFYHYFSVRNNKN